MFGYVMFRISLKVLGTRSASLFSRSVTIFLAKRTELLHKTFQQICKYITPNNSYKIAYVLVENLECEKEGRRESGNLTNKIPQNTL
jgi:hypothetical protein